MSTFELGLINSFGEILTSKLFLKKERKYWPCQVGHSNNFVIASTRVTIFVQYSCEGEEALEYCILLCETKRAL